MDERVAEAIGGLEAQSMRRLVTSAMRAFVDVYHRHPAFVVIWWRGGTNAAVRDFQRRTHNRHIARDLFDFALAAGLLRPDTGVMTAELAAEVGDRVF